MLIKFTFICSFDNNNLIISILHSETAICNGALYKIYDNFIKILFFKMSSKNDFLILEEIQNNHPLNHLHIHHD